MQEQSLKEKTAKGLLWGGIGNGIQQSLNLIFGIFLARLLTPADYGMVGMLAIFTAIANTLQESGFIMALANRKKVSHYDYNAVFWFNIFVGVSIYAILFFSAPLIASYYCQPELVPLARYIFLGFVISSTSTAQSAYLFRNLMVKQKAVSQFPALLLSGIIGVIMAYHGMSYWGIATQSLVYILVINGSFWYFSPWRPTFHFNFQPLREMFGFSVKILFTNIFQQINNNIFPVILGRLFLPKDVGLYTQSSKWSTMGSSFTSGMINSVAQPILAQIADDRDRQQMVFRKMLRFTAYMSFPLMFGLALIAPEFIHITILDKWMPCVPILQILCIWGAFTPIATLYSNLIVSKGKSNMYMWSTLALGIMQIIVIVLIHSQGIHMMVTSYCALNIGWLLVWHHFAKKETGLSLYHAIKDISPYLLVSIFTMCVTYIITSSLEGDVLVLFSKILIAACIYIGILYVVGSKIQQEVIFALSRLLHKK